MTASEAAEGPAPRLAIALKNRATSQLLTGVSPGVGLI